MKDDPEFNILFVLTVKKYKCLYDSNYSGYGNKNVQDRAWETVAMEVSTPAAECKERWRHLRSSYTRYLKVTTFSGNGTKFRKPYYLAKYIHFLLPFTKSRKRKGLQYELSETAKISVNNCDSMDNSSSVGSLKHEEQIDVQHNEGSDTDENSWQELVANQSSTLHSQVSDEPSSVVSQAIENGANTVARTLSANDVRRLVTEFSQSGKHSVESEMEDPDLLFFRSILPDMKEMSAGQKRRFRIGILNLAQEILSENNSILNQLLRKE